MRSEDEIFASHCDKRLDFLWATAEKFRSGNMPRTRRKRRADSPDSYKYSSRDGQSGRGSLSPKRETRSKRICNNSDRCRSKNRSLKDGDSYSNGYHGKDDGKRHRSRSSSGSRARRKRAKNSSSVSHRSHRDSSRREGRRKSRSHREERRRRSDSPSSVRTTSKSWNQENKGYRDDEDGHLVYHKGDLLQARYGILHTLGEGTFGKVVECNDFMKNEKVALKIIRNLSKYREAAYLEIKVLKKIMKRDSSGLKSLCVRMFDWFDLNGHICISFEVLGLSVFEYLKDNDYQPYLFEEVREISYQLCQAVAFLHEMQLTHTDLKPENILLVNSEYHFLPFESNFGSQRRKLMNRQIRLIDFGSATFDHEHHSRVVSTRHYRALEVILETGWSQPCDVWSVGCIIFELYTGNTLFQTHDNMEHLKMMERILGKIPYRIIKKSPKKYFVGEHLCCPDHVRRYVHAHTKRLNEYRKSDDDKHIVLFDIIKKMLDFDPRYRVKMSKCLDHPYYESLRRKGSNVSK